MKVHAAAYAAALATLVGGDFLWLGVLMPAQYQAWIGPLMLEQPRLVPAAVFYLLYPIGLVVFAIVPALQAGGLARAAKLGALFGLLAYGTYDLSNLATLKGWPVQLALVDMAWGAGLSLVGASLGFLAGRAAGKTAAKSA